MKKGLFLRFRIALEQYSARKVLLIVPCGKNRFLQPSAAFFAALFRRVLHLQHDNLPPFKMKIILIFCHLHAASQHRIEMIGVAASTALSGSV